MLSILSMLKQDRLNLSHKQVLLDPETLSPALMTLLPLEKLTD